MAITGHKTLSLLDRYSDPRRETYSVAMAKLAASLPLEADDTIMTHEGLEAVRGENGRISKAAISRKLE